jgi:hypothetical protein
VIINLSVITAGIPSVRRFLSELQTGRLGMVLTDDEIEMTSGHSKMRSRDNSKMDNSQISGRFSRRKSSNRDQKPKSRIQSDASALDISQELRLRPDRTTQYTTHVVGGSSSTGVGSEGDSRKRNDDEISDDKSTTSLRQNGVYQQRDFEMHVEYDDDCKDAESR